MRGPNCTFDEDTDSHVHLALMRDVSRAGSPRGDAVRDGYVNIPAEPHVPADYQQGLATRLSRWGIGVLRRNPVAAGGGVVALLAGLGFGWWWLQRRR